jgi:preprotein translocase subunit Sec61beta
MAEPGGNHWQAAKAVIWRFFEVRKKTHYEQDAMQLSPAQVIVIGLISAVLFVLTLVGIVWLVTN